MIINNQLTESKVFNKPICDWINEAHDTIWRFQRLMMAEIS
jgi:hypothetical protein